MKQMPMLSNNVVVITPGLLYLDHSNKVGQALSSYHSKIKLTSFLVLLEPPARSLTALRCQAKRLPINVRTFFCNEAIFWNNMYLGTGSTDDWTSLSSFFMIKRLTMKTTLKRARSTSKSRGLNLHEQPSELQVDCSSHAPKTPRSPISEMSQGGNYAWLVRTSCPRHEEAPEHDILKSFLQDLKTPKKMAERAEKCLSPVVQLSHSCVAEVILEQTHLDLGDRRLLSPPQRRSLGRVLFSHVRSASGHSLLNRRFSGSEFVQDDHKRLFLSYWSCFLFCRFNAESSQTALHHSAFLHAALFICLSYFMWVELNWNILLRSQHRG